MPGNFNPWQRRLAENINAAFTVHNDIFYIGNRNSVSTLSSSGFLLDYIAPAYIPSEKSRSFASYRENNIPYYVYPLEHVGAIGVANNRKLFLSNLVLSRGLDSLYSKEALPLVQLLLYENKRVVQSIGEDGPNGSNFYSVKKIFTRKNSDIVVYSIEKDAHVLYFFDENNYFLYKVVLFEEQLPVFQGQSLVSTVDPEFVKTRGLLVNVVPSLRNPYVYVQVRYYDFVSESESSSFEVRFNTMKVFRIDLLKKAYDREIPLSEVHESLTLQSITDGENLLFMGSILPEGKSLAPSITLLKVNQYGFITRSYELEVPFVEFVSYAIDYDEESKKVGAYYIRDDHVSVVWWRLKGL